jgi:SAM-dependent methyltransferase
MRVADNGIVTELDPEILGFYQQGKEASRLTSPEHYPGPLEYVRTQELVSRHLPQGRQRILDVGGGPGHYSKWLSDLGHDVTLVDPVPLHVDQALAMGIRADIGDARRLDQATESVDVVLMLGPLYHLRDRAERLQAMSESVRVVKEGGVVFAAAISRFAALLDLLVRLDRLDEPPVLEAVTNALATGEFGGDVSGLFTTAYLHRPAELRLESEEAGLSDVHIFNIEGPAFLVGNFSERWADPVRRNTLVAAAQLIEEDPDILGCASHLLVVGTK